MTAVAGGLWTLTAALEALPRVRGITRCPACGEYAVLVDLRVLPGELRAHWATACVPCIRRLADRGAISGAAWLTVLRTARPDRDA